MKLVLCLAIVSLSAYIGRLLSQKTAQRLILMRDYQSAVIQLCDSVIGRRLPLVLALETCQDTALLPFFKACAAALKASPTTSISRMWKDCFGKAGFDGLRKEDTEIILRGGTAIETLCANPSEKQAGVYIRQMEHYIHSLDAEKQKKCKLFRTSGVLAGLMIALLVI